MSFFQGSNSGRKISVRPCVVSPLLVVVRGLVSLAVCLLPVRGQSLLSYSPVWPLVPTTRCQGWGGFVALWKCRLRRCLSCKIK